MNKPLKVGAIVRFLNAVGGGRVARISKDTAWVEDEDGFEIPTPINQCVVVDKGDTFMPKYKPPTFIYTKEVEHRNTPANEPRHKPRVEDFEDFDSCPQEVPSVPSRMPHTFLPAKGNFSSCLAFLPQDIRRLGQTEYECYLINDSEYSMYYILSKRVNDKWQLLQRGELFPQTDSFITTIASNELNEYEHLSIQILAFADNPGIFKEHIGRELRLELTKFFKLHSFVDNDFFQDKAFILPIQAQENNSPKDWESIGHQLQEKFSQPSQKKLSFTPTKTINPNTPHVIDLHIDALVETTAGMSNSDILSYQIGIFNQTMQAHLNDIGRKLIFIHGKGDGVLRKKLLAELKYRYKHCDYQDASFELYSYGATQVTIKNKRND